MSIKQKYENLKMFLYYNGMLSVGGIKINVIYFCQFHHPITFSYPKSSNRLQ